MSRPKVTFRAATTAGGSPCWIDHVLLCARRSSATPTPASTILTFQHRDFGDEVDRGGERGIVLLESDGSLASASCIR